MEAGDMCDEGRRSVLDLSKYFLLLLLDVRAL